MDQPCLPADGVPKGVVAVRGYRSERAAMRQALRTALREARIGLRTRRIATLLAAPPPAPDVAMANVAMPNMRAVDPPAPSLRPAAPPEAPGVERTASADGFGISVLTRLLQTEATPGPSPQPEPVTPMPVALAPVVETPVVEAPVVEAPVTPAPAPAAPPEHPGEIALPLARLGFGAGMSARLSQLGIHDTADLAAVDPAGLREALGEISRLVDIDSWVAHARALNTTR